MSDSPTTTSAGWYPTPNRDVRSKLTLTYWDGKAWTGAPRPAGRSGQRPRDTFGTVALIGLLVAIGSLFVPLFPDLSNDVVLGFFLQLSTLATIPAFLFATSFGIAGAVVGRKAHFRTTKSVLMLVVAGVVLFAAAALIVLIIVLTVTGNYHI